MTIRLNEHRGSVLDFGNKAVMSSSEKGVSLSLYEKVKIKTTPTVLNGASTKHGLVSRGTSGITPGKGRRTMIALTW